MIYILRGIPGSGKTTWADNKIQKDGGGIICSANHFFETEWGYRFDEELLHDAHLSCLKKFTEKARLRDEDDVFVDNTNVRAVDVAPYVGIAEAYGHGYEIVRFDCEVGVCVNRNIHGVPKDKIGKMFSFMERLPPFWDAEKRIYTGRSK